MEIEWKKIDEHTPMYRTLLVRKLRGREEDRIVKFLAVAFYQPKLEDWIIATGLPCPFKPTHYSEILEETPDYITCDCGEIFEIEVDCQDGCLRS